MTYSLGTCAVVYNCVSQAHGSCSSTTLPCNVVVDWACAGANMARSKTAVSGAPKRPRVIIWVNIKTTPGSFSGLSITSVAESQVETSGKGPDRRTPPLSPASLGGLFSRRQISPAFDDVSADRLDIIVAQPFAECGHASRRVIAVEHDLFVHLEDLRLRHRQGRNKSAASDRAHAVTH